MKLVYETGPRAGQVVTPGETVGIKGTHYFVRSIDAPKHGGSTGRVYVQHCSFNWIQGYYPSVIGAVWIEREDQY